MKKSQQINLSELQEWLCDTESLYAADLPHKKLVVTLNGTFKIYMYDEVYWQGIQPYMAVEKYNAI